MASAFDSPTCHPDAAKQKPKATLSLKKKKKAKELAETTQCQQFSPASKEEKEN